MAPETKNHLQISQGYRGARRLLSALCALGLGWSTAQYEVKSLSLGTAGIVDLSNASISLVLACGIVYMLARCMIEYAMQPDEVRQWHLAQIDFKTSLFLVYTSLLILAAGGLYRSVDTVIYVAIGALILLVVSVLLSLLGFMVLMPLVIKIKARKNPERFSVAFSIMEAEGWSYLISLVLVSLLLIALGVISLKYEPLSSLWTIPPSPLAVAIFVCTAIVVIFSLVYHHRWERELFARPAPYTETKMPDGTIGVTFHHTSDGEQDQSQSAKNDSTNDESGK